MIINIHGYNGTPNNTNYQALCKAFPNELVYSRPLDYDNNIDWMYATVLDAIEKNLEDVTLLVGQSLGAALAIMASRIYEVPCILTNPCVDYQYLFPFLKDRDPNGTILQFMNQLVDGLQRVPRSPKSPICMIVGDSDIIVNTYETTAAIKPNIYVELKGEGHDLDLTPVLISKMKEGRDLLEKISSYSCT